MDEIVMYQVIATCKITSQDYPSVIIFKDESLIEEYKKEYSEALIENNIFRASEEFELRVAELKAIM